MFCFFSTWEKRAGRRFLLAEHTSLSQFQSWAPPNQANILISSTRWHSAGKGFPSQNRNVVCIQCCSLGPAKKSLAGFPPHCAGWEQVCWCGFFLHHLRPYMLILAPNARGKLSSCRALHGQEELGLLNKQLFNILFSLHCSMCGLKPSPVLNTELVLSLQAFRQAHREQWLGSSQAHLLSCILTFQTKKEAKKQRTQDCIFMSLWALLWTPKDVVFWATLHVLSTSPADVPSGCAPPALPQSRSQVHILEKISVRSRQFEVFHNKLAWKGFPDWTPGSWQQPRVKQVLQSCIHRPICLPSNFCNKWAKVLHKPLPSLPSPQLTTSKGAGTDHRQRLMYVHLVKYLGHFSREILVHPPWSCSRHLDIFYNNSELGQFG